MKFSGVIKTLCLCGCVFGGMCEDVAGMERETFFLPEKTSKDGRLVFAKIPLPDCLQNHQGYSVVSQIIDVFKSASRIGEEGLSLFMQVANLSEDSDVREELWDILGDDIGEVDFIFEAIYERLIEFEPINIYSGVFYMFTLTPKEVEDRDMLKFDGKTVDAAMLASARECLLDLIPETFPKRQRSVCGYLSWAIQNAQR